MGYLFVYIYTIKYPQILFVSSLSGCPWVFVCFNPVFCSFENFNIFTAGMGAKHPCSSLLGAPPTLGFTCWGPPLPRDSHAGPPSPGIHMPQCVFRCTFRLCAKKVCP
ncbi:hypothetical protein FKM82_026604 [Ascaphus truei]